jgi:hypothetical protein
VICSIMRINLLLRTPLADQGSGSTKVREVFLDAGFGGVEGDSDKLEATLYRGAVPV